MAPGSRSSAIAFTIAAVIIAGAPASAHRLDELLQAARIGIAADRVDLEVDLTPGVAVADRLIAEIDRDHDGLFSSLEQRAYVDRVFAALALHSDDTALTITPSTFDFPDLPSLRSGDAAITIRATGPLPAQAAGAHRLLFDNRYQPGSSVYLANALVPDDDRIAITAQDRDRDQQQLTIHYAMLPAATPFSRAALSGILLLAATAAVWAARLTARASG